MKKVYPNILQSFGIAGIIILCWIVFSPFILFREHWGYFLFAVCSYILAFYIINRIRKKKNGKSTFQWSSPGTQILGLIILITIALQYLHPLIPRIPLPKESITPIEKISTMRIINIYNFIFVVLIGPILEELIFRGIMLDGLLKKYKPIKSILICSLVFTTIHFNVYQYIVIFCASLLWSWIYYKTRNMLCCIVTHVSYNFVGYFIAIFATGMNENTAIYYLSVSLIVLVGGIYLLNKMFNKKNKQLVTIQKSGNCTPNS